MKKMVMSVLVIAMSLMACLVFVTGSFAQPSTAGAGEQGAWTLDVTSVPNFVGNEPIETVMGKVMKVEKMPGVKDGLQLRLVTEDKVKYTVLLGPKWFIGNQKLKFMANDKIEVRGKKIGSTIIASEASKGDWTMKLRNEEDGLPAWQCCIPRKK